MWGWRGLRVKEMLEQTARLTFLPLALFWALNATAMAQTSDTPGQSIQITLEELQPPVPGAGTANSPHVVAREDGDGLRVPPGFTANLYAEGLAHPRSMMVAPNGDVLLAESREGRITLLRDEDGDGRADLRETFASGYQRPYGLALRDGFLYVADIQAVWRVPFEPGALSARGREPVTPRGALGTASGHWTRNLVIGPNGEFFFVAIGSRSNLGEDSAPRATVQRFRVDGSDQTTFAGGLRNPIGIAFYPGTNDLYVVVNERDGYGDDMVPDYMTRIEEGDFFGWPYAYVGPHADPEWGEDRPDLVAITQVPDVLFQAHSAPIGLTFYDRDQFPEPYRSGAFVSHRGSWNANEPTGYRVVFVPFEGARPAGGYEVFATGFRRDGGETAEVWGRPTGLVVAQDGSLLVADDTGGTIWRITYSGD